MYRSQNMHSAKQSNLFNKPDADVKVEASDGIQFALHKRNLSIYTGRFPLEDSTVESDVVKLDESSRRLELLFQFVYPPGVPSLRDADMDFHDFMKFARVAEKYVVYIASRA
ncbi:hypothetical protein BDQ17DRAFT_1289994 [Cyathus striatus]|nr:hypothetical protein BDQ17DRAFT_1289994 [Cyathus striatus]